MIYDMINAALRKRLNPRFGVSTHGSRRAAAVAGCWLWAALFAVLVVGCTRDFPVTTPGCGDKPGTAGYATLQLKVPGSVTPGTYAAEVTDETQIAEGLLHAIVYARNEEGNWQFRRVVKPEITDEEAPGDNGYRVYNIRIPFYEGDLNTTFCLGLISGITEEALKAAGGYDADTDRWTLFESSVIDDEGNLVENPMARVRNQIVFTTTGKWPVPPTSENFVSFPMWGESEAFLMHSEGAIAGTIRMTRAVARIDVGVNFLKTADGHYPLNDMQAQGLYNGGNGTYFRLESVRVYRTSKNGTYGASAEAYDESGKLVRPTVTTGGVFDDKNPLVYTGEEITTGTLPENTWSAEIRQAEQDSRRCLTRQCYVPETVNSGAEFDGAACLVIGGRFGSQDAVETYYRIDFAEVRFENGSQLKPTPESRMDLLRNNAYVVNITSVSGAGEESPDDALTNDNTKLTAEIVAWDQGQQVGDIVTDGVYSLSVDKSEVQYYADGTPETFTVKTDYEGELGVGWKMTVEGDAEAVVYYDEQGNAISYGDPLFPTTGVPGTKELRIGMAEYYNDAEVQTRSARLVFTAGRMKTQVVLNQTSRELLRLRFNPEELYFGPQGPEKTVTITVTTRKDYKLTVKGSIENEEGVGGEQSYEHQIHPATGGNPDDRFLTFFVKKDQNDNDNEIVFRVEPTHMEKDRIFTFDITAERTGTGADPTDPQMKVTESFVITQLKEPVEWKVQSVDNMPTNVLNTQNPYEVIVPNTAMSVTPRILTTPGTLRWWFSKGGSTSVSDAWIINLAARVGVQMDLQTTFPAGDIPFTLEANTGLSRRSVTLNVESTEPGLDPTTSRLIITQKGAPLTLQPFVANSPGTGFKFTGPTVDPTTGKSYYELHHGYDLAGGEYVLGLESNTNWYWYWNLDDPQAHATNLEMLAPDWALQDPGPSADKEVTTDGPNGIGTKKWSPVARFAVPGLESFNVPEGWEPGLEENPAVPIGGTRTVVRELRNSNPQLTPADVEDNAKQLRITRSLPAYTRIAHWPFLADDMEEANSDRAASQYTSLDAFLTLDPETNPNGYVFATEPFSVLSNAPVKLTVMAGSDPANQGVLVGSAQWDPQKGDGYKQKDWVFTELFDHGVDENSWTEDAQFFKLTATVENQQGLGKPNSEESYSRIYFRGQRIELPKRNMGSEQRMLSSASHTLKLDFSNSYFKQMRVRVLKRLINTDGSTAGVEDYVANAKGGDNSCKEIHLTPAEQTEGTWDDGITLLRDKNTTITCELGANMEINMMYQVVVQTYSEDASGGTGKWVDLEDLHIYQDAKPIVSNYVVLYRACEWSGSVIQDYLVKEAMYRNKLSSAPLLEDGYDLTGANWLPGTAFAIQGSGQSALMGSMVQYNEALATYKKNGQVANDSRNLAFDLTGPVYIDGTVNYTRIGFGDTGYGLCYYFFDPNYLDIRLGPAYTEYSLYSLLQGTATIFHTFSFNKANWSVQWSDYQPFYHVPLVTTNCTNDPQYIQFRLYQSYAGEQAQSRVNIQRVGLVPYNYTTLVHYSSVTGGSVGVYTASLNFKTNGELVHYLKLIPTNSAISGNSWMRNPTTDTVTEELFLQSDPQ